MEKLITVMILSSILIFGCANKVGIVKGECVGTNTKGICERFYNDNGTLIRESYTMTAEPAFGPVSNLILRVFSILSWPITADID